VGTAAAAGRGEGLDQPGATRDTVAAALGGGFSHIVLSVALPYRDGAARWLAGTVIAPVAG
jgi:hypothetical protein